MSRAIALAAAAVAVVSLPGILRADPADLWESLRLDELVEVMAEEGRLYGADLAEQLFADGGGPSWEARVADLYDAEEMAAAVKPLFVDAFEGIDTQPLETFFASELGTRIVDSELAARRAFLDPGVEAAATERAERLREEAPGRYRLIRSFVDANDLIETNVASSLTFTYAFNLGLVEGDMEGMTETEARADAWAQEEAMREDTARWLDAQLSVAFAPLSDDEVRQYVDLSETEAGGALNAALFAAFEPTFTRIARELGEAVARSIGGRDI